MLGSPLTVTPSNRHSTVPDVTLDPLKAALADILWGFALWPTTLMTTMLPSLKHTVTNKGNMTELLVLLEVWKEQQENPQTQTQGKGFMEMGER